jgi:hypothetical protein
MPDPLASPSAYQAFIYSLPERYEAIERSALIYVASGSLFGRVEGRIFFAGDIVLCVQEFLNFELNVIEGYGYEVSRSLVDFQGPDAPDTSEYCRASYARKQKFYWYDSFPHPNDPSLASTDPHHKHVPPDTIVPEEKRIGITRHRIPAPDLSFTRPNLPFLIEEIERELLSGESHPGLDEGG